ncbi:MAG: GlxA family transcriptional regulator [Hyphomicrobiales bacterium]
MKSDEKSALPSDIGILLTPGFSMLAFFAIIEPIRLANQLIGQPLYRWTTYSGSGGPIRASCGMTVATESCASSTAAPGCVFVVAGFDPWPQTDGRLKSWLRSLDRRGTIMGAVDTGAFLLASAGLLDGVSTALHWESAVAFTELFPDIPLSDRLFILHPRRWLCPGGSAAVDMMLELLEREHGAGLCSGIESRLMHRRRKDEPLPEHRAISQPSGRNEDLAHVLQMMETHVEEPIRIATLAERAALSQRSLERKCRHAFGRTPAQLYLDVRLERARQILRHSDLTVRDVAVSCGFTSVPYFCRAYKAHHGMAPGGDRKLDISLVARNLSPANSGNIGTDLGND